MDDNDALKALAGKYLDLWVEHWAASLAAPEAGAMLARLLTPAAAQPGNGFAGFDAESLWQGALRQPPALRTAPNAGDGRIDELERRIAALEQRLAESAAGAGSAAGPGVKAKKPAMARPARKPRGGTP